VPVIPSPAAPTTVQCGVGSVAARRPQAIGGAPATAVPGGPAGTPGSGGVLPATGRGAALEIAGAVALGAGLAVRGRARRQRSPEPPYSASPTG
jgi:hypothetical protein